MLLPLWPVAVIFTRASHPIARSEPAAFDARAGLAGACVGWKHIFAAARSRAIRSTRRWSTPAFLRRRRPPSTRPPCAS